MGDFRFLLEFYFLILFRVENIAFSSGNSRPISSLQFFFFFTFPVLIPVKNETWGNIYAMASNPDLFLAWNLIDFCVKVLFLVTKCSLFLSIEIFQTATLILYQAVVTGL